MVTYLAHGVVVRNESVYCFNGLETLIYSAVLSIGVEDIGRHDSGEIVNVHLASRFLIHMREG